MISQLLFEETGAPEQAAIITPERSTSWGDLRRLVECIYNEQQKVARRRVGLSLQSRAESYAALAALDKLSCDVFLFDGRLPSEEALRQARNLKLGAFLGQGDSGASGEFQAHELPGEEAWSGSSTVTILTSGSTGEPKAARHSWESLSRPVRKGAGNAAPRWLLTYRPNLYAGLQVALQCFADRGTLLIPGAEMDPSSVAEFMHTSGAQFVSATPSYWRRLLMFSDPNMLRKIPLVQITLGGEIIDQSVLHRLRGSFPNARLVHIYATTELGRCFSVTDGLAGFPARYLDAVSPDGVELRVVDGELLVRSPNSMRMYDPFSANQAPSAEWFATGDLVAVRDGRVHFVGRKSEMINVAGSKVYPVEVERVIRAVPGVSDVRVFGKASSIAGELVACEIIAETGQDKEALKEVVARTCRAQLTSPQQPRLIKFVDKIDLSAAGKTLRSRST
jgi:acyl-CoA synthetase (AMP-forming)/AMP-acid ligase II